MPWLRRARGALLRLVLARWPAVVLGIALTAPAVWLVVGEYAWESWITDGVALISGATGVALLVAGVSGRMADWIE
jgi:hypothetical protein